MNDLLKVCTYHWQSKYTPYLFCDDSYNEQDVDLAIDSYLRKNPQEKTAKEIYQMFKDDGTILGYCDFEKYITEE